MAFIVKMGKRTREQLVRANQQRIHLKALSRKATFISEYIQVKYSNMYNEAVYYFDRLNATHPTKSDLRKTKEFRTWRASMNGEQPKTRRKRVFNYIKNAPEQSENQWPQSLQESVSPWPQTSDQEPESPWPQTSDQEPESPWPQTSDQEPESPWPQTSDQEPESPWPQTSDQEPESPWPQTSDQEPERISSPDNPGTPATPQERYKDRMILRIPLLEPPQSPPTVTTETIEIVTEQIEPVTFDDIPPERMEELITELQQDPNIKELFDDLQAQLKFEELGLDIDIPELNLLEDELADW